MGSVPFPWLSRENECARSVVEFPHSGHVCSRCDAAGVGPQRCDAAGVVPQRCDAAGVVPQRYERCETSEEFLSVSVMLLHAFGLAAAGHFRAPAAVRDIAAVGFAFRYRDLVASPPE